MAFKFVTFAAFIAVASAGVLSPIAYSQPAYTAYSQPATLTKTIISQPTLTKTLVSSPALAKVVSDDYDPNPQYSFSYDVHDALTGDAKNQQETRNGDVVQGQYSLIEADGTRRVVDYSADPVHGFNAVVRKEAVHGATKVIAAAPAVVAAKTILTQPAAQLSYAAAPVVAKTLISQPAYSSYSSPIATKTIISQPALTLSQPAYTKVY